MCDLFNSSGARRRSAPLDEYQKFIPMWRYFGLQLCFSLMNARQLFVTNAGNQILYHTSSEAIFFTQHSFQIICFKILVFHISHILGFVSIWGSYDVHIFGAIAFDYFHWWLSKIYTHVEKMFGYSYVSLWWMRANYLLQMLDSERRRAQCWSIRPHTYFSSKNICLFWHFKFHF